MRFVRRGLSGSLALLAAFCLAGCDPGPARYRPTDLIHHPIYAGDLTRAECPSGMYVVALAANYRPNEWITKLTMTCARWTGRTFSNANLEYRSIGPGGGAGYDTNGCQVPGSAVFSAGVSYQNVPPEPPKHPGSHVTELHVLCWHPRDEGIGSLVWKLDSDITQPGASTFGAEVRCNVNELAIGIQGHVSDKGVSSFGLLCAPEPHYGLQPSGPLNPNTSTDVTKKGG